MITCQFSFPQAAFETVPPLSAYLIYIWTQFSLFLSVHIFFWSSNISGSKLFSPGPEYTSLILRPDHTYWSRYSEEKLEKNLRSATIIQGHPPQGGLHCLQGSRTTSSCKKDRAVCAEPEVSELGARRFSSHSHRFSIPNIRFLLFPHHCLDGRLGDTSQLCIQSPVRFGCCYN